MLQLSYNQVRVYIFVDAMIHPTIFLFWMFELELTVTTMMHRHNTGIRYNKYLTP
jgi:hypothetical protein